MQRYELRDALRAVTTLKRLRGCGRWRIEGGKGVEVWVGTGRDDAGDGGHDDDGGAVAHFRNVQTCGSPWACPVCSAKIRQQRAEEIEAAALAHLEAGGALYTCIFTIPHDAVDRLTETWDVLRKGFTQIISGRRWTADRERYGIEGFVRAQEVTHGGHGWHPHAHALFFTDRALSAEERAELADRLHGRWARYVEGGGYRAPARFLCDLHPVRNAVDLAGYLSKAALVDEGDGLHRLGLEMARADLKEGRRKGRTPWELARGAAAGVEADVTLWREWERASKRQTSVRWSNGFKARFGIGEATDDELAAAEAETPATCAFEIEPGEWDVIAQKRGATDTVLLLTETAGADVARDFIRRTVAAHVAECVSSTLLLEELAGRAPP